ncbi:blue light receptor, partial [Ceratobasidium sp. 423]
MSQLSLIGLRISTTTDSPPSSKSGSSRSSASSIQSDSSTGSETDAPAAYHVNLLNLIPTLQVPPPLRGMSRLRAAAQRQFAPPLDVLGILAKVVMRPRPVIHLGPIDHTASCVIVDLDLPDHPLVWASDSFCQMSGYTLEDIRGRNPRFMQAPGGHALSPPSSSERNSNGRNSNDRNAQSGPVPTKGSLTSSLDEEPVSPLSRPSPSVVKGPGSSLANSGSSSSIETTSATPKPEEDPSPPTRIPSPPATYAYIPPPRSHVPAGSQRIHTNNDTIQNIKSKLDANEEVQSVVLNYRKDGTPFWNWLSIVPVREEERF